MLFDTADDIFPKVKSMYCQAWFSFSKCVTCKEISKGDLTSIQYLIYLKEESIIYSLEKRCII